MVLVLGCIQIVLIKKSERSPLVDQALIRMRQRFMRILGKESLGVLLWNRA
jgi:hypothetical protein